MECATAALLGVVARQPQNKKGALRDRPQGGSATATDCTLRRGALRPSWPARAHQAAQTTSLDGQQPATGSARTGCRSRVPTRAGGGGRGARLGVNDEARRRPSGAQLPVAAWPA